MKRNRTLILVAGSLISFVVVFFAMAFAMGLMNHGPVAFITALAGKSPAVEEAAGGAEHAAAETASRPAPPASTGASSYTAASPSVPNSPAPQEIATLPQVALSDGDFLSRAEALARIEEALQKRQEQMEEEKAHLLALQRELEATNTRLDSLEQEAIEHLARVYGSMRPETAAEILVRLPPSLQSAIVANMEDKSAGKVLGSMDPRAAARVTSNLGRRPR